MLILSAPGVKPSSNATFDKPIRVARRKMPAKLIILPSFGDAGPAARSSFFPHSPCVAIYHSTTNKSHKKRATESTATLSSLHPHVWPILWDVKLLQTRCPYVEPNLSYGLRFRCGKCTKRVTTTNYFGNFFLHGANSACNHHFVLTSIQPARVDDFDKNPAANQRPAENCGVLRTEIDASRSIENAQVFKTSWTAGTCRHWRRCEDDSLKGWVHVER